MDSDRGRKPTDAFDGITRALFNRREGNVFGWKISAAAAVIMFLFVALIYFNHSTGRINFRTGQPFGWVHPDSLAAQRTDSLRRDSILKHHDALLRADSIQVDSLSE